MTRRRQKLVHGSIAATTQLSRPVDADTTREHPALQRHDGGLCASPHSIKAGRAHQYPAKANPTVRVHRPCAGCPPGCQPPPTKANLESVTQGRSHAPHQPNIPAAPTVSHAADAPRSPTVIISSHPQTPQLGLPFPHPILAGRREPLPCSLFGDGIGALAVG